MLRHEWTDVCGGVVLCSDSISLSALLALLLAQVEGIHHLAAGQKTTRR